MDKDGYHGYDKIERPCPNCEYYRQRAQRWREEAYRQAGHPLPEREWVGLMDEDMKDPKTHNFDFIYGARWAETKLKERNYG